MTRDDVEIIEAPVVYDGYAQVKRVRLRHALHAGGMGAAIDREMVERGHAVGVLPYDPARDAVALIRQFRIGAWGAGDDPWLVETVAGIVDEGESAEDVARREAVEEAGCEIGALMRICAYYPSPGILTERIALYCGIADLGAVGGIHGLGHEGEDIEAFVLPYEDAVRGMDEGRILDAKIVIALQWLAARRDGLRRRFGPAQRGL